MTNYDIIETVQLDIFLKPLKGNGINNIDFRRKNPGRAHYEKMQEVAQKVASRVHEAHQQLVFHDWVPLSAAESELPLRVRKPTPGMLEHFARIIADTGEAAPAHVRTSIYAKL